MQVPTCISSGTNSHARDIRRQRQHLPEQNPRWHCSSNHSSHGYSPKIHSKPKLDLPDSEGDITAKRYKQGLPFKGWSFLVTWRHHGKYKYKKINVQKQTCMATQACNPRRIATSLRPAWATLLLPGQPDRNGKTLSQNNNNVTWKQATHHLLQDEENNPQCLIKYSTWSRGLKTQAHMAAVIAHTWLHATPLWSNSRLPGLVTFSREPPTKAFESLGPVTRRELLSPVTVVF